MIVETANYYEVIEKLPTNGVLTLYDIPWETYQDLLEAIGENRGIRTAYNQGVLQIMTVSSEHESYAEFMKRLVDRVSFYLRIKILFFGSMTMKKAKKRKGLEPDACFYVERANLIGNKIHLDFSTDPTPDIAVEIDIHHESLSKLPIYAALEIPEVWVYDEQALTIYHRQGDAYVEAESSLALPILTGKILTDFLSRSKTADQYEALLEFENWLQSQKATNR
ncbi:MAG: Uma2 family endonuclease [Acidobacteriota bacterium]